LVVVKNDEIQMTTQKNSKRQVTNPKETPNGRSLGSEDRVKIADFIFQFFLAFGPWNL